MFTEAHSIFGSSSNNNRNNSANYNTTNNTNANANTNAFHNNNINNTNMFPGNRNSNPFRSNKPNNNMNMNMHNALTNINSARSIWDSDNNNTNKFDNNQVGFETLHNNQRQRNTSYKNNSQTITNSNIGNSTFMPIDNANTGFNKNNQGNFKHKRNNWNENKFDLPNQENNFQNNFKNNQYNKPQRHNLNNNNNTVLNNNNIRNPRNIRSNTMDMEETESPNVVNTQNIKNNYYNNNVHHKQNKANKPNNNKAYADYFVDLDQSDTHLENSNTFYQHQNKEESKPTYQNYKDKSKSKEPPFKNNNNNINNNNLKPKFNKQKPFNNNNENNNFKLKQNNNINNKFDLKLKPKSKQKYNEIVNVADEYEFDQEALYYNNSFHNDDEFDKDNGEKDYDKDENSYNNDIEDPNYYDEDYYDEKYDKEENNEYSEAKLNKKTYNKPIKKLKNRINKKSSASKEELSSLSNANNKLKKGIKLKKKSAIALTKLSDKKSDADYNNEGDHTGDEDFKPVKKVKVSDEKIKKLMLKKLNNLGKTSSLEEVSNSKKIKSSPFHKKTTVFNSKENIRDSELNSKPSALRSDSRQNTINNFTNESAKLTYMCSNFEISNREDQNLLNLFEIDKNRSYYDRSSNRYILKADPEKCIKAFVRSAADLKMNNPDNVRTEITLISTVEYLLNSIIDIDYDSESIDDIFKYNHEQSLGADTYKKNLFNDISQFIEDRFRSVRQDFTILGNRNSIAEFKCNLIIARFIILCLNQCLNYESFTGHQALLKLFKDQLNKTLSSLREGIESLPIVDQEDKTNTTTIYSGVTIKEISEVIFYSIVLNKDQHFDVISIINKFYIKYITNSNNMSTNDDSKQLFKLSKNVIRVFSENNYSKFFKILKSDSTTYLESSILSLYINEMRIKAFNQIAIFSAKKAPNTITMSLRKLKQTFLFNSNKECLKFLEWYGIDLSEINMFSLLNSSFNNDDDVNITLKTNNSIGEYVDLYQERNDLFIEIKRNKNRKDVCLNGIDLKCLKDALYNKAVEDSKKNINISFTKSIENSNKKNINYKDHTNEMNDINLSRTNKRVVSKEKEKETINIDTRNRIKRNKDVTELKIVDDRENKSSGDNDRKESGFSVFNVSSNLSLDKLNTLSKENNNSIFNLKENSITNTNANLNNINSDIKDKTKNSKFDNINNSNNLFSNNNTKENKNSAEKNNDITSSIFNSNKESTFNNKDDHHVKNFLNNPQSSILANTSLTNIPDFNGFKNNDKIENDNILSTLTNKEASNSLMPNKEINNSSLPMNSNDPTISDINKKSISDNENKTTDNKNIENKTNVEHKQKPSAITIYNTKVKSLVDNKYFKKSFINKLNFCFHIKVYYDLRLATFKERKSRNVKINFLFHLKSNILEKQYKKQVFELSYNSLIADNKNSNTNILNKSLANNHQYLSSTEQSFNNKYDISLLQKNNVIQSFQDILDKMIIDYIENVDKDNHYYILNPSELDLDKNNNSTIIISDNQTSNLSFNEESPIVISLKLRIACFTYKPLLLKSQFYKTFFSQQANKDTYYIEENEYYLKVKYSNSISYKKTNPLNSAIVNLVYKFEIDYDTYFLDIIEAFGLITEFVSAEFLSLISYNKYFLFIDFSCMSMLEQSLSFIQLLNIEKKDFILFYYNSEMIYFRHYLNNVMLTSQTNYNTSLKEIVERQLSKDSKNCNDSKSIHNWNILKLATDKLNIINFVSVLEVDEFLNKLNTSRLPNFNKETINYDMRYKYYITNIAYQNNNLLQYLFNNKTFSFIKQEYYNKTSLNSIFNNLSFFFNNKQNIVDPYYNKIDNLNNDSMSINKSNDNSNIKKNNMSLNTSLSLPNSSESKSKSKNTHIKSVQQELVLIKNSYWKNFFTQLRQAIVGITFINEVLSSSIIINNEYLDFVTKIGINQEQDADFYFFFKKIFKEFSIKINSIQMNSFFKKLFRMKDFSFEEFIKAPTLIEFLEMLLMRYEKEFIIVMEKYLDYFEVKYGFKDEEKSFRENNNYLLMKASKLSLIKELLMKNRKEFNSIFRKDINNMNNMNNTDISNSNSNLPLFFNKTNCISSCYSITYHLISYFSANIEIINRVLCGYSTHLSSSCYFSNSTLNTDYYNNNKSFLTPKWFNALLNKNHNEYSLANYKEALFSDEVIFTSVFHVFTDIHESDAFSKEDMISKILINADKAFYSLGNIFICPEITLYMRMAHIRLNNLKNIRNKNECSTYSESKLDYMKFYLNNFNNDSSKDSRDIKDNEIHDLITNNTNNSLLHRKRNKDYIISNLTIINNYNINSNYDNEDFPNNICSLREYKSRNTFQAISNVASNYSRLRNIPLKNNNKEANGAFGNKSFNDVLLNQSFAMDN